MPMMPVEWMDFSGGHNDGVQPAKLQENEAALLDGFYVNGTSLTRIEGIQKITSLAYKERVTSFISYKNRTGSWTLVAGTRTGLAKLSGTTLTQIPTTVNLSSQDYPWDGFQYNDILVMVRRASGSMFIATPDRYYPAGIEAPSAAPVIAQGAAGTLAAGDYQAVIVYGVKNADGLVISRGNASAASNVLTLGANRKIDYSAIPVSTNPRVNIREIYRTFRDAPGRYFLMTTIEDNSTTTYTGDEVDTDDLGLELEDTNGVPPSNLEAAFLWDERAWVTDGVDWYPSEAGLMESFASDARIPVGPDDGQRQIGGVPTDTRALVFKQGSIWSITSIGDDYAVDLVTDKVGAKSRESIRKTAEGKIIFFGGDNFYYIGGVGEPVNISRPNIKTLIEGIRPVDYEKVVAGIVPERNWYVASIPDASGVMGTLVIYDYVRGIWMTRTLTSAPTFLGDVADQYAGAVMYAARGDENVYQMFSGTDDAGTPISARFLSRALTSRGQMASTVRVGLMVTNAPRDLVLQLWHNKQLIRSRSVYLYDIPGKTWKWFNFKGLGTPAGLVQLGLLYEADQEITIDGIAIDTALMERTGQPR